MVPIDETNHLLTYEEVDQVVVCLAPAVLIPIHYFVPGLTDPASPLGEPRVGSLNSPIFAV